MGLVRKQFTDRQQFFAARLICFRITHSEFFQRIKNNLGNDYACVLFFVGGHNIPWHLLCAGRTQALKTFTEIVKLASLNKETYIKFLLEIADVNPSTQALHRTAVMGPPIALMRQI